MKYIVKEFKCNKCQTIFEEKLPESYIKNIATKCPNCDSKEVVQLDIVENN
jgi:DNA-directed RNA polymerase subunit RPC12/RpoP